MYDESWLPRIGSNIRLLRGACQFNQQQFAERIESDPSEQYRA